MGQCDGQATTDPEGPDRPGACQHQVPGEEGHIELILFTLGVFLSLSLSVSVYLSLNELNLLL